MSKHSDLPKEVREHEARVGRLSRMAAKALGKDERAAYLAGIHHDDGKLHVPPELLSGREITEEEYELIKEHAVNGYKELKGHMKISALCAGLHHRMGVDRGYGITLEDIPEDMSFYELKKLLDIATIVSIADFIDAFMTRTTSLHVESTKHSLEELLIAKYPAEPILINIMLNLKDKFYYSAKEEGNEHQSHSRGN